MTTDNLYNSNNNSKYTNELFDKWMSKYYNEIKNDDNRVVVISEIDDEEFEDDGE
jgi:hypothetical protein